MTEVERIKAEFAASNSQETQVETPVEKPIETPVESEEQPVETEEEHQEQPVETPVETEEPPVESGEQPQDTKKTPKDTSMYSKEEKAQHAFKRQLARQKEKFESQVAELTGTFKGSLDEIKKEIASMKKAGEAAKPKKTRADFDTDDEYIAYLAEEKVNATLAQRDEAAAKEREKKEQEDAEARREAEEQQELQETFSGYCRSAFPEAASFKEFAGKVDKALNNGLGEILDKVPHVRDYLFTHSEGPVILNEMLTNRESFVRVMQHAGNPMDAVIEMHDLLRDIREKASAPAPATTMPHLGKPGSSPAAPASTPGKFKSDDEVIAYLRSRAR